MLVACKGVCHACGWLCFHIMHVLGCVCVFCVSGCEPSILLTPSGLCVGLFNQHYHLLVFYSGPKATMTAEPCRFAHQAHQIDSIALNLAPISYHRAVLSWIACSSAESRLWTIKQV